jgi:hypothetical protein
LHKHSLRHDLRDDPQIVDRLLIANARDHIDTMYLEIGAESRNEMLANSIARTHRPFALTGLRW